MPKTSNESKNLTRLAGEFLVASRLAQRGYMTSLQWGTTIGYDLLVFDKTGRTAFLEVKSSRNFRRWVLQKKYANPEREAIPLESRFVCCVNLDKEGEPEVFVFPAEIVAKGLHYFFGGRFPNSQSYHLSLDFKPQGRTKEDGVLTVGKFIEAESFLENYSVLGLGRVEE